MEFGFGTGGANDLYQISREQDREADMVTGDLNAAHVEWVVQYEISDPEQFLFNLRGLPQRCVTLLKVSCGKLLVTEQSMKF